MVETERLLTAIYEESPTGAYLKRNHLLSRNSDYTPQFSFRQLIGIPDAFSSHALITTIRGSNRQLVHKNTINRDIQITRKPAAFGENVLPKAIITTKPTLTVITSAQSSDSLIDFKW